jgi:dolichyl-phosphate beta-glucosyltransferase
MEKQIYLSVIIPAYNEEKRLPSTLREMYKYLSSQSYSFEIIVVSDGSTDKTVQVAERISLEEMEELRVIDFKKNYGKGYGVKIGMLEAKGKYRLFMDADNSTSVDQVEKMFPWFEKGYDVVIGSRDIKGAVLDPPQPFHRRFVGSVFRFLTHLIIGTWKIKDSQCGFKCLTQKATEDICPKCTINKFSFDPEILVLAKKMNYKIKEIPVHWKNDLNSKVKLKSTFNMFRDLLRIRLNMIKGLYDVRN